MRVVILLVAFAVAGCASPPPNEVVQARRCRTMLSLDSTRADSVRTLLSRVEGYRYDCASWIALVPADAP